MSEIPQVSKEFIEESKLDQTGPKKNGGPYSTSDKIIRRNKVHELHFDHGYSSRKIADMMKINRKTIDNDISYWHSKILEKWEYPDPEVWFMNNMENLEVQKTRVREELEGTKNVQHKIMLEKLLLDIESRRIEIEFKICNSVQRYHRFSIELTNKWLEKHGEDTRYLTYWDTICVSSKAHQKINEIMKQEKPFLKD